MGNLFCGPRPKAAAKPTDNVEQLLALMTGKLKTFHIDDDLKFSNIIHISDLDGHTPTGVMDKYTYFEDTFDVDNDDVERCIFKVLRNLHAKEVEMHAQAWVRFVQLLRQIMTEKKGDKRTVENMRTRNFDELCRLRWIARLSLLVLISRNKSMFADYMEAAEKMTVTGTYIPETALPIEVKAFLSSKTVSQKFKEWEHPEKHRKTYRAPRIITLANISDYGLTGFVCMGGFVAIDFELLTGSA